jgi:hypothetical protein
MNEKQVGNSQRLSEMEEDCTGSQGPQQTAAVEDEKICDTDSRIQLSCNSESSIVYPSSTTTLHTQYTPLNHHLLQNCCSQGSIFCYWDQCSHSSKY